MFLCFHMAPVKISHVVSFSSQDSRYPVENLLDPNEPLRPWLSSPRDHSGQLKVELQLERAVPISYIDIGNCGCAFLQVDVGRSSWPPGRPFLTLLPMATLMSPADSKLGKNRSGVRMFKDGDFMAPTASESWDRLRVTCSQPFNRWQPFGLMFLRVRSLQEPRENPESSQACDQSQSPLLKVEPSVQELQASPWLASPAIRRTFFPDPQPSLGQVTELRSRLQQLQPGALGRSAHMVLSAACRALPSTSKSLGCPQGEPSPNHTANSDVPEAKEPGSQEQNSENESSRTKRQKLQNPGRRPPATPRPRQCRKVMPRRQLPQPQTSSDHGQESGQCPICAGSFSFEVLPLHAATCGENSPPHPVSPSSSSSSSLSPPRTPSSLNSESPRENTPPPAWVQCPICQGQFPAREVAWHASRCGEPPENPWMGLD
ncbi:putative short transient receptor potential channel 2-like protein isoform X1 [Dromiciops gliroides]|uniref:putative short transient receptor potential channel 2-like protein isoform X1 n=1 Tax=Dromiciops gliroides TaxID=33562 RepID=UPI001CC68141|nr:putative short transient receptor potential channel 2-like protein isoform X1 [Dromiciops gliroides]